MTAKVEQLERQAPRVEDAAHLLLQEEEKAEEPVPELVSDDIEEEEEVEMVEERQPRLDEEPMDVATIAPIAVPERTTVREIEL